VTNIISVKKLSILFIVSLLNISLIHAKETKIEPDLIDQQNTSRIAIPSPLNIVSLDRPTITVEEHFKQIIVNIDSTLFTEQVLLKSDKSHLENFVDSKILPHWNIDLTLKQLIGSKNWQAFTNEQINALEMGFNKTMHRYVREGMDYYDGQRIKLLNVRLNKKNTRGIVTIQLEPIYLPAFNIIFKIAHKNSQWRLYDVLVEGISYVKMKKNEYRRLISEQGVEGLLAYLEKKNRIHESSINQSNMALKNAN